MNVFGLFFAEMAKLVAKKGVLLSVLAALLVPVVYGGILLSPTWGPYDNLSNLPVAVVNNDVGATSDDEQINVGEDLVADLKKGKNLGWKFVDSAEARKGLDSSKYFMVIEIPEDFSERVTSVLDPNPKKLELNYIQNEGLNFMAAQVTKSATEKIRENLANKITEKYVKNIFASLEDVSTGFQTAADGSAKLHDGTVQLNDGTTTLLQSLTEKSGDISKLADGANQLEAGTGQLLGSLSSKQSDITKLANGSKDLKDGTSQLLSSLEAKSADISKLAKGANAANDGTSLLLQTLKEKQAGIQELAKGAKQLQDSTPALKKGTADVLDGLKNTQSAINGKLLPGASAVSAGVNEVVANSQTLGASLVAITGALENYLASNPDPALAAIVDKSKELRDKATNSDNAKKLALLQGGAAAVAAAFSPSPDPKNSPSLADGVNQLIAGQTLIAQGAASLDSKAPLLAGGTASVESGWANMIEKVGALQAGTQLIAAGNSTVNTGWGTITAGVKKLDGGASQISAGNASVDNGWRQLTTGASKLHSGMTQVSDGTANVNKGWGDLTDGVTQLNDGAGKLNAGSSELANGLKDGAAKTADIKADDDNISMFSSPVELASDKVNGYEFYRDSTAPYVLSLALLVGILIMSMFINFTKPAEVSALQWFGAKFMNLAVLGIVQALLLSIVVLAVLGLNVQNPFGFVFFAVTVSIIFSAIILFFASFGNIGRFVAFALIVLQLSTTGANLPIAMLPENLRNLSEFLPLTYSIAGFKSVISLNDFGSALANLSVLFVYFIAFGLLALTVFLFKFRSNTHSQSNDLAV